MALKLTLTDSEVAEVRLQLGTRLTTEDISDDQIKADSMLGMASVYCTLQLFKTLGLQGDATIPSNGNFSTQLVSLYNGTSDNLDTFVASLPDRLEEIFRNAVIYRTAGQCVVTLRVVTAEVAAGISQRQQVSPVELRQAAFYAQADELINLMVEALPADVYKETALPEYLERWSTLFALATPR